MKRLTFEGNFCDIAKCRELPCKYDGGCAQKEVWERLKAYEDSGCEPGEVLPKGKAGEIALNLMRLAGLESLCSYDRLRELAEADKDMTAAQLYFYQWQAAFNQLTQAISHIKDEDKAGKLCAAIRAQLAAWGKTMEDTQ